MRLIAFLANVLVALVVGVGAPPMVLSAPISATFEGTISEIHDPFNLLDHPIEVGSAFTISYSIDPDAPESELGISCSQSYGGKCSYRPWPRWASASLALNGIAQTNADPLHVYIAESEKTDVWQLEFAVQDPDRLVTLLLADRTGSRLSDASFYVNEGLAGWTEAHFTLFWGTLFAEVGEPAENGWAAGTIIPEPAPLALLLPALVGVIVGARLRRRAPICDSSGLGVLGTRRVGLKTKDHNRGVDPPEGRSLRRLLTVATNHQLRAVECR